MIQPGGNGDPTAGSGDGDPDAIEFPEATLSTTVIGGCKVFEEIGRGGFGVVYRGEQISVERFVAIKVLLPNFARDQSIVARFVREAKAVSRLRHPNTVTVHDSGRAPDGTLYIIMELLGGRRLKEVMDEGRMPVERAVHIIAQVCDSLAEAHDVGVIHRDIKPENVIVEDRGSHLDFVKVLDFGIAHLKEGPGAGRLTQDGSITGTRRYMAPERHEGKEGGATSDQYSVAVMLYEMVASCHPHADSTASTDTSGAAEARIVLRTIHDTPEPLVMLGLGVSPALSDVVARALAKDPEQRYPSVAQFREALLAAVGESVVVVAPRITGAPRRRTGAVLAPAALAPTVAAEPVAVPSAPSAEPKRRVPWAVVAVGVVALGLVGGLVLIIDQDRYRSSSRAPEATSATPTQPRAPTPAAAPSKRPLRAAATVRNPQRFEPTPARAENTSRESSPKGRREKGRDDPSRAATERARALDVVPPAKPVVAVPPSPVAPPPVAAAPPPAPAAPQPHPHKAPEPAEPVTEVSPTEDGPDPSSLLRQAEDAHRRRRYDKALELASHALAQGGGTRARLLLGRLYLIKGSCAEARKQYEEVLARERMNPEVRGGLRGVQRCERR